MLQGGLDLLPYSHPPMNALPRLPKAFCLMGDAVSSFSLMSGSLWTMAQDPFNGQEVIYTDPVRTRCSFSWGSCKGRAVSMKRKREGVQGSLCKAMETSFSYFFLITAIYLSVCCVPGPAVAAHHSGDKPWGSSHEVARTRTLGEAGAHLD